MTAFQTKTGMHTGQDPSPIHPWSEEPTATQSQETPGHHCIMGLDATKDFNWNS